MICVIAGRDNADCDCDYYYSNNDHDGIINIYICMYITYVCACTTTMKTIMINDEQRFDNVPVN